MQGKDIIDIRLTLQLIVISGSNTINEMYEQLTALAKKETFIEINCKQTPQINILSRMQFEEYFQSDLLDSTMIIVDNSNKNNNKRIPPPLLSSAKQPTYFGHNPNITDVNISNARPINRQIAAQNNTKSNLFIKNQLIVLKNA